MVVFNFDGILSEFRELFQKIAWSWKMFSMFAEIAKNLDLKFANFPNPIQLLLSSHCSTQFASVGVRRRVPFFLLRGVRRIMRDTLFGRADPEPYAATDAKSNQ